MENFQGIVFIWTQSYREIFKSALVYLYEKKPTQLSRQFSEKLFQVPKILFKSPKLIGR